jgi:hypothetical protein
MAASRLSDSQKSELVARYRAGEGSAELAAVYGCSANTVSRTVKAALPPREYEQLKQDRARGLKPPLPPLEIPDSPQQPPLTTFDAAAVAAQADQVPPVPPAPLVVTDQQISQFALELPPVAKEQWPDQDPVQDLDRDHAAELAIEDTDDFVATDTDDSVATDTDDSEVTDTDDFEVTDTDDFEVTDTDDFVVADDTAMEQPSAAAFDGGDGEDSEDKDSYEVGGVYGAKDDGDQLDEEGDELDDDEEDGDELDEGDADEITGDEDEMLLAVAVTEQRLQPVSCQPLKDAPLPASVYMLVDKTVELEARPLKEFPELGMLPPEEEELQALQVFVNPRQAKRHCGRSQRVIKIPDTRIFERTASHLLAQGISRLVIENSLYSLPGA